MRILATTFAVILPVSAVSAQPITFDSDAEILVIRAIQVTPTLVSVELIGPRDGGILCVAIDSDGQPIATTTGRAERGSVYFEQLDAAEIDHVACRYR